MDPIQSIEWKKATWRKTVNEARVLARSQLASRFLNGHPIVQRAAELGDANYLYQIKNIKWLTAIALNNDRDSVELLPRLWEAQYNFARGLVIRHLRIDYAISEYKDLLDEYLTPNRWGEVLESLHGAKTISYHEKVKAKRCFQLTNTIETLKLWGVDLPPMHSTGEDDSENAVREDFFFEIDKIWAKPLQKTNLAKLRTKVRTELLHCIIKQNYHEQLIIREDLLALVVRDQSGELWQANPELPNQEVRGQPRAPPRLNLRQPPPRLNLRRGEPPQILDQQQQQLRFLDPQLRITMRITMPDTSYVTEVVRRTLPYCVLTFGTLMQHRARIMQVWQLLQNIISLGPMALNATSILITLPLLPNLFNLLSANSDIYVDEETLQNNLEQFRLDYGRDYRNLIQEDGELYTPEVADGGEYNYSPFVTMMLGAIGGLPLLRAGNTEAPVLTRANNNAEKTVAIRYSEIHSSKLLQLELLHMIVTSAVDFLEDGATNAMSLITECAIKIIGSYDEKFINANTDDVPDLLKKAKSGLFSCVDGVGSRVREYFRYVLESSWNEHVKVFADRVRKLRKKGFVFNNVDISTDNNIITFNDRKFSSESVARIIRKQVVKFADDYTTYRWKWVKIILKERRKRPTQNKFIQGMQLALAIDASVMGELIRVPPSSRPGQDATLLLRDRATQLASQLPRRIEEFVNHAIAQAREKVANHQIAMLTSPPTQDNYFTNVIDAADKTVGRIISERNPTPPPTPPLPTSVEDIPTFENNVIKNADARTLFEELPQVLLGATHPVLEEDYYAHVAHKHNASLQTEPAHDHTGYDSDDSEDLDLDDQFKV